MTKTADTDDGVCNIDCSLREAIAAANNSSGNDTINFGVPGNFVLTLGQLVIVDNGSLRINSTNVSVTVSGNNASRVFLIYFFADVTINNVTIINGNGIGPISGGGGADGGAFIFGCGRFLGGGKFFNGDGAENGGGGGICSLGGSFLTLNRVTVRNNSTENFSGGGIYVGGSLAMNNSTVSSNTTNQGILTRDVESAETSRGFSTNGGGIYFDPTFFFPVGNGQDGGSSSSIVNSTISGNSADSNGGGIHNDSGFSLSLRSVTIANNTAGGSGGGFYGDNFAENLRGGSSNFLGNTIVAGNAADDAPDVSGLFISDGYNFIGKNNGSNFVAGNPNANDDIVGTSAAPRDPQLQPLANNGGPTPTHALLVTSPAVDKGNSFEISTDQRGEQRPSDAAPVNAADGSDIGAFELQAPSGGDLSLILTASAPIVAGGNLTYTVRLNNNGPGAALGVVMTVGIPANTTYQSVSFPSGWKCRAPTGNRGSVRCTRVSFAADDTAAFGVRVRVNPTTPVGTNIVNQAQVDSDTGDPNLGNNAMTVASTVTGGGSGGTRKD